LPAKGFFNKLRGSQSGQKTAAEDPSSVKDDLRRVPGAVIGYKLDPWWWLVVVVALIIIAFIVFKSDPYWNILKFVSDGVVITAILTLVSFVFIIIVGVLGGLGRISKNPVIHLISTLYVEIIRGIPLLVQLLYWYFAVPVVIKTIGEWLNISALANYQSNALFLAIIGLVICYGAYMAEIFRAGIQSIHQGQMEAARSLGMSYLQAMRYIILPQALKVVLPPVGNEFIMLLKDTSLVSVVAVTDLTRRGREFMAAHFIPIEVWTLIALLYLIMTLVSARFIAWLEKKRGVEG